MTPAGSCRLTVSILTRSAPKEDTEKIRNASVASNRIGLIVVVVLCLAIIHRFVARRDDEPSATEAATNAPPRWTIVLCGFLRIRVKRFPGFTETDRWRSGGPAEETVCRTRILWCVDNVSFRYSGVYLKLMFSVQSL